MAIFINQASQASPVQTRESGLNICVLNLSRLHLGVSGVCPASVGHSKSYSNSNMHVETCGNQGEGESVVGWL